MKSLCLTMLFIAMYGASYAQWTTTGNNIANSNTGYVNVNTMYVSTTHNQNPSAGSLVVGEYIMGVFVPTPLNSSFQHYIKLDQPNNQVLISNGNSDLGGGFNRQYYSGETRFFSNPNPANTNSFMTFYNNNVEAARIDINGNLMLNTTSSHGYKFAVNGGALATSVTVLAYANWPDYVFKRDYSLPSLTEVKTYIDQHQHLPEIPSAQDVEKDGLNLGDMNKILVKKVEELTLYLIDKDKQLKEQDIKIDSEEKKIDTLENELSLIKKQLEMIAKKDEVNLSTIK